MVAYIGSSNLLSHAARAAFPTATSLSTSVLSALGNLKTSLPPWVLPHSFAAALMATAGPARINTSVLKGAANVVSKLANVTKDHTLPSIDCRSPSPSVTTTITRIGPGHHTTTHSVVSVNTDFGSHEVVETDGVGAACCPSYAIALGACLITASTTSPLSVVVPCAPNETHASIGGIGGAGG